MDPVGSTIATPRQRAATAPGRPKPLARFGRYAEGLAKNGYSPEKFGELVREVFEKEKPKTRYAIVPGRFANFTVPRLLPDRWLDRLIARNVGLT